MATTTHGDPQSKVPALIDEHDEELWDKKVDALLEAGNFDEARAEFDRRQLAEIDSDDSISLEDAVKHKLPGYTVSLLLEQGDTAGAKIELERLVLEGIDSGDPLEVTPGFWKELRSDLHRRAGIEG